MISIAPGAPFARVPRAQNPCLFPDVSSNVQKNSAVTGCHLFAAGTRMAREILRQEESRAQIWRLLWVSRPLAALIVLSVSSVSAAELKSTDLALIDRLTWGVTPSGAQHLKAIGTNRWIEEHCIRWHQPTCRRPLNHKLRPCQTSMHLYSI
jgi:hypothetical protein